MPKTSRWDGEGSLVFSSLDELSLSDLSSLVVNGPSFLVGNASGLEYLSDLEVSPDGQMYTLQSFSYEDGNFDPHYGGIDDHRSQQRSR